MSFKLKKLVVFLKIFTCLLLSRPYETNIANEHNIVANPNWKEAEHLAIYKRCRRVELGSTEKQIQLSGQSALTTRPCRLPLFHLQKVSVLSDSKRIVFPAARINIDQFIQHAKLYQPPPPSSPPTGARHFG